MAQLSQTTKKLILQYRSGEKSLQPPPDTLNIHVDEVASKVAAFYEKIRGIIDWREEHLLKSGAIERILKRRFLAGIDLIKEGSTRQTIAEPLILELIRGGHYPNDRIPETKIVEVQKIIDKYIFVLKNTPQAESGEEALRFYNWLLGIAACEIEETLSSSYKERALIDYMFELMKERLVVSGRTPGIGMLKEEEKNIQIYIAVQRALFKLDGSVLSYHLLKYKYPNWQKASQQELIEIVQNILSTQRKIERSLVHPLSDKFYQICERYDTPYLLLGDIISSEPSKVEQILSNPEVLEDSIRDAYKKRIKTLKSRVGRAAVYATFSILVTKVVLTLAIEIPIDRYLNTFNSLALMVNVLTPPILMFFLISTIHIPGRENLERTILETMKIVHETEKKDTYEVKTLRRGNLGFNALINFIYFLTFILSLGLIIWVLSSLNFSLLSIIIFIIFVSLIAFTGTKIRQRAEELQVIEERESLINPLIDLFAVPLIEAGKWLTLKWQKYNIVAALFNIMIDVPFMIFVEFIEQWRFFLKEKKEKIH